MSTDAKLTIVFVSVFVLFMGSVIFLGVFGKDEKWEKLDNAGNCYLHVIDDDSAFGRDRETRETYCKESK